MQGDRPAEILTASRSSRLHQRAARTATVDPAPAAQGGRRLTPYARGLLVLGLVYLVLYGGLLAWTGGLPYVSDNNESFSTLWHARNMAELPFDTAFWLTDEVFSPHVEAHPYVHTHQGNFPRLFAFVLYVLGARTIEAQIVITVLTVGSLTVAFLYHFLTKLAGPRFALITGLVFLTDYVYFAQWHVVTYRVWHAFFLFAGLLCAHGVVHQRRRGRWLLLTLLTFAGLFYYELIFVAFVSLLCAFYALVQGWRTPRRVVLFGTMQALGGAMALLILFAQLTAYLGWEGVRQDLYLTYVARNFADPTMQGQIEAFYQSHNVAFWKNQMDSSAFRSATAFVKLLFGFSLQGWTPLLVSIVLVVLSGWLLGLLDWPTWMDSLRTMPSRWGSWIAGRCGVGPGRWSVRGRMSARFGPITVRSYAGLDADLEVILRAAGWWLLRVIPLALAAQLALVRITQDRAFLGIPGPTDASGVSVTVNLFLWLVALALVVGGLLLTRGTVDATATGGPSLGRVAAATLLLWAVAMLLPFHPAAYDMNNLSPIWWREIGQRWPVLISRGAFVAAVVVGTALALGGSRRLLGRAPDRSLRDVAIFLGCGVAATVLVYLAATGYVISGYVWRYAPLWVFVLDIVLGVVATILVTLVGRAFGGIQARRWRDALTAHRRLILDQPRAGLRSGVGWLVRGQPQQMLPPVGVIATAMVTGLLCLFSVAYWIDVQRTYVALIPPMHFRLLKALTSPPYQGASFVVDMFAAPVAAQTGQWAYFDPLIASGKIQETDNGYVVERDLESYLWLADRRTNVEYRRPEFYACMIVQDFRSVIARLANLEQVYNTRCSDRGLVRQADMLPDGPLRNQVVARDEVSDTWVIVKLDWDFPPYLAPLDDGRRVGISAAGPGAVIVQYRFVQQDGQPEQNSIVRLYSSNGGGATTLLAEGTAGQPLTLPDQFSGLLRASVTPRTATKAGRAYFSDDVQVTDGVLTAGAGG